MSDSEFPLSPAELVPLLSSALPRSAHEGARIVALHWMSELLIARDSWARATTSTAVDDPARSQPDAADALHRARVALRRLRATLREHRVALDLDEGRRVRRALQRINRVTGTVRDNDVHREWLASERESLSGTARKEADALMAELARHVGKGRADVTRAFERHLDPYVARLARRLSRYCVPRVVGQHGPTAPFARHLAERMERGSAHLHHDLSMVDDVSAQDVLHRIRIRLKRQRALLVPFARADPTIGAWYALATEGQDLLGAMRDAMLLAELAELRGYKALARALQEVALAHYEAFHQRWCGDGNALLRSRSAAAQALRAIADTTAPSPDASTAASTGESGGLPAGHGLPMEIERKFLLHGLPPRAATAPSTRIEQGWLPGIALRERLRREVAPNERTKLTRTIKLGPIGARIEVEEPAEPALFEALWPHTVDARIRKRRHRVPEGTLTWEIDVFLDRDLVLAEVELAHAAQEVEIPAWLAPFIVREVTQETAYLNSVMARPDVASPESAAR